MNRTAVGLICAALVALSLAPPVDALPGGKIGVYAAQAAIAMSVFALWSAFRQPIASALLFALAVASLLAGWLSTSGASEVLVPVAARVIEALVPCDGGCGVARTDGAHTLMLALIAMAVLLPLAVVAAHNSRFRSLLESQTDQDA